MIPDFAGTHPPDPIIAVEPTVLAHETGVGPDALAHASPEQPGERNALPLGRDVPQGDVERGAPEDPEPWRDAARHGIAIAAGENLCTLEGFLPLMPSLAVVQPSVTKGG